ncbi:hypothetical protein RLIN73S_07308 [Rhodanobacter lindaniclasticus]
MPCRPGEKVVHPRRHRILAAAVHAVAVAAVEQAQGVGVGVVDVLAAPVRQRVVDGRVELGLQGVVVGQQPCRIGHFSQDPGLAAYLAVAVIDQALGVVAVNGVGRELVARSGEGQFGHVVVRTGHHVGDVGLGGLVGVVPQRRAARAVEPRRASRHHRVVHAIGQQVAPVGSDLGLIRCRPGHGLLRNAVGIAPRGSRDVGVVLDADGPAGCRIPIVDVVRAQRIGVGQHPVVGTDIGVNDVHAGPARQRTDRRLRAGHVHLLGLVAVVQRRAGLPQAGQERLVRRQRHVARYGLAGLDVLRVLLQVDLRLGVVPPQRLVPAGVGVLRECRAGIGGGAGGQGRGVLRLRLRREGRGVFHDDVGEHLAHRPWCGTGIGAHGEVHLQVRVGAAVRGGHGTIDDPLAGQRAGQPCIAL